MSTAAEDEFGFLAYADALALLINDADTATPLTVGISGTWGSGKTSLAKLLEERLAVEEYWRLGWNEPPVTCWFNAWLHRDADHLGAAFTASVTRDLGRQRSLWRRWISPLPAALVSPRRRLIRRAWTGLALGVVALGALIAILASFPELQPVDGPLGALIDEPSVLAFCAAIPAVLTIVRSAFGVSDSVASFVDAPRSVATEGSLNEVRDQLGRFLRQVQKRGSGDGQAARRVVIFVDDLERCSGEKALDVCETASQLLGHDDVITILVADFEILDSAASARYRSRDLVGSDGTKLVDGHEYMHKIVQLRFNMPPLPTRALASALGLAERQESPLRQTVEEEDSRRPIFAPAYALVAFISLAVALKTADPRKLPAVKSLWSIISRPEKAVLFVCDAIRLTSVAIACFLATRAAYFGVVGAMGMMLAIHMLQFRLLDKWSERRRDELRNRVREVAFSLDDSLRVKHEERRLALAQRASRLDEAERSIADYLSENPRRAKRLINHHRVLAAIAEDRGVFGGAPSLTHRHLAKWVLILEHWPEIAALLARDPSVIAQLEEDHQPVELRAMIQLVAPQVRDVDELICILEAEPPLAQVLERLVRFESSNECAMARAAEAGSPA